MPLAGLATRLCGCGGRCLWDLVVDVVGDPHPDHAARPTILLLLFFFWSCWSRRAVTGPGRWSGGAIPVAFVRPGACWSGWCLFQGVSRLEPSWPSWRVDFWMCSFVVVLFFAPLVRLAARRLARVVFGRATGCLARTSKEC